MRSRKYRERRNSAWERRWLQRELDATGLILDGAIRRRALPPATATVTRYEGIAAVGPKPVRRTPRRPEPRAFN